MFDIWSVHRNGIAITTSTHRSATRSAVYMGEGDNRLSEQPKRNSIDWGKFWSWRKKVK